MSTRNAYLNLLTDLQSRIKLPVVNHIVNQRYSSIERILLHLIGISVIVCGVYVCLLQYRRYLANPAVVSVERDFYDWNGTLPSITFCYTDNLSTDKANEFISTTWNVEENPEDEKYQYYRAFLEILMSSTVYNLAELLLYHDDPTLQAVDFETTIKLLTSEHDHYVSSFLKDDMDLIPEPILTERGLCYTVNSLQRDLLSIRNSRRHESSPANIVGADVVANKTIPIQCNFVQDQCFMKLDIFGFNASIAVHSFYEPIRYETSFYDLGHDDEIVTTFKLLETINDDLVRDLTFAQRKCLFNDEQQYEAQPDDVLSVGGQGARRRTGITVDDGNEISNSVYSLNLCLLKCRAEMAIALCGCKPHFYPFIDTHIRGCNLQDVKCLVDNAWPANMRDEGCDCPKTCNHLMYSEGSFKLSTWMVEDNGIPFAQKSSFRAELLWPRMRLRRDVLFTFSDLVVSFGGAVTFFMALNCLDTAMVILYFVERLAQGLWKGLMVGGRAVKWICGW